MATTVRLLDTDEGRQLITSLRNTGAFTANLTMLNLGKESVLRYLLHHHPETIMPKATSWIHAWYWYEFIPQYTTC